MTGPSYLAAIRESYDTVAADYVQLVKSPAELDPLSRAMPAAFAETVRAAGPPGRWRIWGAGPAESRRIRRSWGCRSSASTCPPG